MTTKQDAAELRAHLLQELIRRLLGPENTTGFYVGLNAMMVAPELHRAILKDIERVPAESDHLSAGRQALEQGSEHLRKLYEDICALTPEASS